MDLQSLMTIFNVLGYCAFIIGGIFYARSRVPNQTIDNYEKLSVAQEKRIKALEDQSKLDREDHIESMRAIADLQGQIKVYKELPLQEMAIAMDKISHTQEGILDSLNESDHQLPEGQTVTTVKTVTKK